MCRVFKLRKKNKLKKPAAFQLVYRQGRSVANRLLVLYIFPNGSADFKIGFAAGKRLGNAVVRNRVKRLMREVFRLHNNRLPRGYDYILVGRQPIVDKKMAQVEKMFLQLVERVNGEYS